MLMSNPSPTVTLTPDETTLLTFLSSIPLRFRKEKWDAGWSSWAKAEYDGNRLSRIAFGIAHALVGANNPVAPTDQDRELAAWFLRTGFGDQDPELQKELDKLHLRQGVSAVFSGKQGFAGKAR